MALLERVSTLVRANLNDLIDRAEHPEKMIKQVILDMQNQLLRSEEHTSELQSQSNLVCRLLLEKKKKDEFEINRSKLDYHHSSPHTSAHGHVIVSDTHPTHTPHTQTTHASSELYSVCACSNITT